MHTESSKKLTNSRTFKVVLRQIIKGKRIVGLLFIVLSCLQLQGQVPEFELIPSAQSGVTFSNQIEAKLESKENLFDYDYFYNGAGVGVLDINNDGLQDIYFAANQAENKLYLNQGDFKFEDVTSSAFQNFSTQWSTGVSVVDINQDGWQDIYVCQSGPRDSQYRQNLLFINNGDQTFTESAATYGLNDSGMSTQALFLDYDKDGDLDCFVMNESLAYGLDPVTFTRLNLEQKPRLYESYSHFYTNENGLFVDKTKELGLDEATFGLGIRSCDVNQDGWPDIYIANDYYVPDMLFINKKGKGFVNQIDLRTKQMSFYGMGMDIADINNDGHSDIFVLDMASGDHYRSKTLMRSMNVENFRLLVDGLQLPHQYMFNSLQLNNGNGTYSNIAHSAGVSSTDWSWSVLIEDFDYDGLKDIYVTNGYRRYALDNDFQKKVRDAQQLYNMQVPLSVKGELYNAMPTEKLANVFYKNAGELKFEHWSMDALQNPPSYSNGAAIADFDNDGDPDIVVNNMDEEAFIYRNGSVENAQNNFLKIQGTSSANSSIDRVELFSPSGKFVSEPRRVRGYMSSSEPSAFIGLGQETQIDSVKVVMSNGDVFFKENVKCNTALSIDALELKDASASAKSKVLTTPVFRELSVSALSLDYNHQENDFDDFEKEILLPYKQSSIGPFISASDLDRDGLQDFLVSNALGSPVTAYRQTKEGFEQFPLPDYLINAPSEFGEIATADLNKDGRLDYLLPAGGNEYIASDSAYESSILLSEADTAYTLVKLPNAEGSAKGIAQIDYDMDGDLDLLVYKRQVPQQYPMHAPSVLYENKKGRFIDVTEEVFPALNDFGIINDVQVTNLNGDKRPDLVIVGEWTNIGFFENRKSTFVSVSEEYEIPDLRGLWFSVEEVKLNKDKRPDFIIGNIGENVKYKASNEKPLKVYGGDFDNNGTWDLVLSKPYKDAYVPLRGLECSSQQMPFIKDKFKTYDLFAKATIEDVYGPKLDEAYSREVNTLSSYALISQRDGTYRVVALPAMAQTFPILDIEQWDVDGDGREELILAGNIYDTEVETPRLDAGMGLVLSYDGTTGFSVHTSKETGLNLSGNVKSTCLIYHKGLKQTLLFATQNNGPLKVFSIK